MASATSTSAKNLFADSKRRLADRVGVNINNSASLVRQIVRGSKTSEIITQAAKNLAQKEETMDRSAANLQKIQLMQSQLQYQFEAVRKGAESLEDLKEATESMQR